MIYFDETPQMDAVGESYDRLPIKSLSELAVDGKILLEETGKPGKWVSEALQLAEKAVVEQRIKMIKTGFDFYRKKIDLNTRLYLLSFVGYLKWADTSLEEKHKM